MFTVSLTIDDTDYWSSTSARRASAVLSVIVRSQVGNHEARSIRKHFPWLAVSPRFGDIRFLTIRTATAVHRCLRYSDEI